MISIDATNGLDDQRLSTEAAQAIDAMASGGSDLHAGKTPFYP